MKPRKKSVPVKRELFTILGEIKVIDEKKHFVPFSRHHMDVCIWRLPVDKKVTVTFTETKTIRSKEQLRYHFVLMGYLAQYTGYTREEIHDAVMRIHFGEKAVILGDKRTMVRKSMGDGGGLSKAEVVELIEYDLSLCDKFEIRVPTPRELGYVVDKDGKTL